MITKTILTAGAAMAALALNAAMPAEPDLGFCFKRAEPDAAMKSATFVPIFKVDAETRKVYGRLADETPDFTGEIFDYDTCAPLFQAWSEKAMKASNGKSAGNLRVMHGLKVAGKLDELIFDDVAKTIDLVAEVVDDAEWAMVEKGCYTGFSLGGKYVKKWKDPADSKKTRYTVNPIEASLVDVPCIPTATFTYKAAGGDEEQVAFAPWKPTASQIAAKAAELAGDGADWEPHIEAATKALEDEHTAEVAAAVDLGDDGAADSGADIEAPAEQVETEAQTDEAADTTEAGKAAPAPGSREADAAEGLEQVWKAKDGSEHKTKAAARKANAEFDAAAKKASDPVSAAVAALKSTLTPADTEATGAVIETYVVDGAAQVFAEHAAVKAVFDETVALKGIHDVRTLAGLLQDLNWLTDNSICEAGYEKDGSPVPAQLMGHLRGLSNTLVTMAKEETAEMIAMLQKRGVDVSVFAEASEKSIDITPGDAAKTEGAEAGLPSIQVSAEVMGMVEKAVAALPAETDPEDGPAEAVAKALAPVQQENAALKAQLTDEVLPALTEATEAVKTMRAELEALKAEPLPSAPRNGGGVPVQKGADSTPGSGAAIDGAPDAVIKGLIETHGADVVSKALIKASHQNPMKVL